MTVAPVRVAICEDSRTYAEGLRRFLEADNELEVVAVAKDAEELMRRLDDVRPDLVTMDLELPGIDGVEAIRRIMAGRPVPIVVLSAHVGFSATMVAEALAAGALEAVPKEDLHLETRDGRSAGALRRRLVDLARRAPAARRPASPPMRRALSTGGLPRPGVATVVGIASSAGGPRALSEVLGVLPADFPLPVLVVQHMSHGFTPGLVAWLDDLVAVPVRLARPGLRPPAGVSFAPDGAHLVLRESGELQLDRRTDAGAHRPSADVLLRSVARAAGVGAVAVVLTGMGRDGAAGVAAVRDAGGAAIVERPEQAALWGMPAAAVAAGATPLALHEIGPALALLGEEHGR